MRRTITALFISLLALAAVSCGDDDGGGSGTASPTGDGADFPVTVDAFNGEITIDAQPERIVSISPTATEMLYAVGAGDQVVAVDDFSNFPEGTPITDLNASEPNTEAIFGYEPDLVVMSDSDEEVADALTDLEVPVIVQPAANTLDESYEQIEELGVATGHPDEGTEVVDQMRGDIEELAATVDVDRDEPLTYYHELDDTLFTVTSNTFIGELYALAGLENIADAAQGDAGDYPQLSAEYLIDADPDLVFLADTKCCGQDLDTFAARPGFGELTAVADGTVIELDDDIASRWGPRVVDFFELIIEAVNSVPAGQ